MANRSVDANVSDLDILPAPLCNTGGGRISQILIFRILYVFIIRAGVVLLALPEAHLDLVTGSLNTFPFGRFKHLAWARLPYLWPLGRLCIWLGLTFLLIYIYII